MERIQSSATSSSVSIPSVFAAPQQSREALESKLMMDLALGPKANVSVKVDEERAFSLAAQKHTPLADRIWEGFHNLGKAIDL